MIRSKAFSSPPCPLSKTNVKSFLAVGVDLKPAAFAPTTSKSAHPRAASVKAVRVLLLFGIAGSVTPHYELKYEVDRGRDKCRAKTMLYL